MNKIIKVLSIMIVFLGACLISTGCKDDNLFDGDNVVKSFKINEIKVPDSKKKIDGFKEWIRAGYNNLEWKEFPENNILNNEILKSSLALGSNFMINNQKKAGNFNYQFDFTTMKFDEDDNQVRQAGALWGISLIFAYNQDPEIRKALDKSLEFFMGHTVKGSEPGSLVIFYPGDITSKTGAVALVALGIIEYLRTDKAGLVKLDDAYREKLNNYLKGYIQHLLSLQLENAHFADTYYSSSIPQFRRFNPYADGEVLLCLVKAAKYLGFKELIPVFQDSAMLIAKHYTMDQWPTDPDSRLTKGFYQWSSMAFWEYQDTGWVDSEYYGDYVIQMAWWMIVTHRTLQRTRNTAYAYEGIIPAYHIAKSRNHAHAINMLGFTIDRGLTKLTSWQVGGPLQNRNRFLSSIENIPPLAIGGVMNHRKEPLLRVDVVQHQMHAVILALKYYYVN